MTPEERAGILVSDWTLKGHLYDVALDAVRQAIQEEREAIIERLTEYSDGLKDVLPRDALVVMECAQTIRERK